MDDEPALAESTRIGSINPKRVKKPTIAVMILTVLFETENRTGVTLTLLRHQMEEKFNYTMTSRQYGLLKKNLLLMISSSTVEKTSGTGLTGRMRLTKREKDSIKSFVEKKQKLMRERFGRADYITPTEDAVETKLRHNRAADAAPIKRKSLNRLRSLAMDLDAEPNVDNNEHASGHVMTPVSSKARPRKIQ